MGVRDRVGEWFRRAGSKSELSPAASIAAELVDHLTIHRPQPWTQMTVRCQKRGDLLHVLAYDMIMAGDRDDYETPRYLLDDNVMRTAFVSVTIERLAEALGAAGIAGWSGEHLEVRRVGDRFVVNAIADGEIVASLSGLRERDRLLTPALIARLDGLHETIERRDRELDRELADGSKIIRSSLLGRHSQDLQAWTWAWADPSVSRSAAARSLTLRERGRSLFGRGSFQSSEPFATTVAHLASARLGGTTHARLDPETGDTSFFSLIVQPA